VHAASNCSDSHVHRQVTGISFLCAPHYLNLFRNVPIPEGRSLRRASGLVLVGDQDVIQMGSGESVLGSRQVFTNCGRFTCTINRHLGQMPPKPVAGLPIQIGNDKGRYHSLKSTARGRSCGSRLLAFVATLPLAGRGCSKLPRSRLLARINSGLPVIYPKSDFSSGFMKPSEPGFKLTMA
jgi:hypothetical protein